MLGVAGRDGEVFETARNTTMTNQTLINEVRVGVGTMEMEYHRFHEKIIRVCDLAQKWVDHVETTILATEAESASSSATSPATPTSSLSDASSATHPTSSP